MAKTLNNRIGEVGKNHFGRDMIIVNYQGARKITVKFDNGYEVKATYQQFKNGDITNPYDKTLYGIGYIGIGKHKCSDANKKATVKYERWKGMFRRCYGEKSNARYLTYIDCTVCEEWCDFQKFGDWFDDNYYEINNMRMELDKDILIKHNKVYSPERCVFVPYDINTLFIKSDKTRGNYPIGVHFDKKSNSFRAQCSNNGKVVIGWSNNAEDAFYLYKKYKEKHIKKMADKYKDEIPLNLYEAMYKYEVEITD